MSVVNKYMGTDENVSLDMHLLTEQGTPMYVEDDVTPEQVTSFQRFKPETCIRQRVVITTLTAGCVLWSFALRFNLSVAIVAMVSTVTVNNTNAELCPSDVNSTVIQGKEREFHWSSELQGFILGSYYYGYLVTQIPGGRLAERFGARRVIGCGLGVNSVLALLTPVSARLNVYLLIAVRVCQGLAEGVVLPSTAVVIGKWAPITERARINAFVLSGSFLGIVVSQLLAGVLSDSDISGGWPSVFYVMGSCGLISAIIWILYVRDDPGQHCLISSSERDYIEKNTISLPPPKSTPWKAMLKSRAVWAINIAMLLSMWCMVTLASMLPTYIEHSLHAELKNNGLLSSLPYIIACVLTNVCGVTSDFILRRGWMSTSAVRKLMTFLGGMGLAGFTAAAGFTGCDATVSLTCLTLGLGLSGCLFGGLFVNPVDIGAHFAGTLFGIANAFGNLPGFVGPYVAGHILGDEPSLDRWRTVFLLAGGICGVGTMFFVLFSGGDVQVWAVAEQEREFPHIRISAERDTDGETGRSHTRSGIPRIHHINR